MLREDAATDSVTEIVVGPNNAHLWFQPVEGAPPVLGELSKHCLPLIPHFGVFDAVDYSSAVMLDFESTGSGAQDVFIGLLLAIFVFVSEDLSCIAGGILAAAGTVSLPAAVAGCFFGIFISDVLLYWLGRVVGEPAFKIGFVARAAQGGAFLSSCSG